MDIIGWLLAITITALYGWYMYYRGIRHGAVGLSNILVKAGVVKSMSVVVNAVMAYRNKMDH